MAKFDPERLRAIAAVTNEGNQIFLNALTAFNKAMAGRWTGRSWT